MWRISIHRAFDSLGGPLSPCGSHWLRSEPFTQIRSRTLWMIRYIKVEHMYLHYRILGHGKMILINHFT